MSWTSVKLILLVVAAIQAASLWKIRSQGGPSWAGRSDGRGALGGLACLSLLGSVRTCSRPACCAVKAERAALRSLLPDRPAPLASRRSVVPYLHYTSYQSL